MENFNPVDMLPHDEPMVLVDEVVEINEEEKYIGKLPSEYKK